MSAEFVPIYQPYLEPYCESAIKALKSGWVSNHGEFVDQATHLLQTILSSSNEDIKPYVILMNNGTCATHCLFIALKFKYPSLSKIYVPNNLYIAAITASLMVYPLDVLEVLPTNTSTWNVDVSPGILDSLQLDAAVLIVHNLGNVIDINKIKTRRPDLVLIEDACEAFSGSYSDGNKVGSSTQSLATSFSFYANKLITSGEGGCFVTTDEETYNHIKKVYCQGMNSHEYFQHDMLAYNYRMTNVQAALLFDQLKDLDKIMSMKAKVFQAYFEAFKKFFTASKYSMMKVSTCNSNWLFAIRIHGLQADFSTLRSKCQCAGFDIRPFFLDLHKHSHLQQIKYMHKRTSEEILLNKEIIMLPSYPTLTLAQINLIVIGLDKVVSSMKE